MGCHAPFQGISPTQGWNSRLLHYRQMLYPLSHQRSPTRPSRPTEMPSVSDAFPKPLFAAGVVPPPPSGPLFTDLIRQVTPVSPPFRAWKLEEQGRCCSVSVSWELHPTQACLCGGGGSARDFAENGAEIAEAGPEPGAPQPAPGPTPPPSQSARLCPHHASGVTRQRVPIHSIGRLPRLPREIRRTPGKAPWR